MATRKKAMRRRFSRLTVDERANVLGLLRDGLTAGEVTRRTGVSRTAVWRIGRAAHLPARRVGRPRSSDQTTVSREAVASLLGIAPEEVSLQLIRVGPWAVIGRKSGTADEVYRLLLQGLTIERIEQDQAQSVSFRGAVQLDLLDVPAPCGLPAPEGSR